MLATKVRFKTALIMIDIRYHAKIARIRCRSAYGSARYLVDLARIRIKFTFIRLLIRVGLINTANRLMSTDGYDDDGSAIG